ncbi:hypothetical protein ABIE13_002560 [Ottowia thiooxydans]|uniref:Uncharacterized protein n=1 Tax=Ottowia thiooxydans TaxID=219182 RepID=A0ABV2Q8W6_9BURK
MTHASCVRTAMTLVPARCQEIALAQVHLPADAEALALMQLAHGVPEPTVFLASSRQVLKAEKCLSAYAPPSDGHHFFGIPAALIN